MLVRYLEANDIPVVIGCDANSHHVAWGSTDTNCRGAALLEYIANPNLEIVNRGSEPTFVARVREQVVDITFYSASIWQEIVNWRVSKEVALSDHRIIRFRMSADPKLPHEYRNLLSTDWDCYKIELVSGFGDWGGDILTEDDIENSVNVLQLKIIAAYEKTCPLKRARLNQSTPYWSSDLAGLCKVARRACSSNPEAYRKALKEYDRALRRIQRSSWRDFCSSVEGMKPTARLR
jgi:hypothetical protein